MNTKDPMFTARDLRYAADFVAMRVLEARGGSYSRETSQEVKEALAEWFEHCWRNQPDGDRTP